MTEKRGTESWVGYQVRRIKTQVLEEVRRRVDAAIPTLKSSTANSSERLWPYGNEGPGAEHHQRFDRGEQFCNSRT